MRGMSFRKTVAADPGIEVNIPAIRNFNILSIKDNEEAGNFSL